MNNIKLFMLLIMAATSSVALADEKPYSFEKQNNNQTLIVNGTGNLAEYGTSTTVSQFNSTAVDNVFLTDHGTSVSDGQTYQSAATYYAKSGYKQIYSNGVLQDGDYLNNVTKHYTTWNSAAHSDNTYIYPVTLTPKTLWKESATNVDGTYIYPAYLNGTQNLWKENATADNTYIYYAHLTSQAEWNASNVNLYSISGAPTTATTDIWKTSALTASGVYVYPVEYIEGSTTYSWNTSYMEGKHLYEVSYDGSLFWKQSDINSETNLEYNIQYTHLPASYAMANNTGTLSSSWPHYIIYSTTEIDFTSGVLPSDSRIHYVTSDIITETTPRTISITANRLTSGNYSDPETYTCSGTTYVKYILSSSAIESDVSYDVTELESNGITQLTSMSEYHEEITTTTVTLSSSRITTGTSNVVDGTYSYDYGSGSTNYVKYVTLNDATLKKDATVEITSEGFTPLTSIDDYRVTRYVINQDIEGRRGTGYYTAPKYYYNPEDLHTGEWGVYYVLSTTEWPNTTVYVGDANVTVLTEAQLAEYWETKTVLGNDNSKTRMTSQEYAPINNIVYDDTYVGYVKLDQEWPASGDIYAEDNFVHFLTSDQLNTYLEEKNLVTRPDNASYVTYGSSYTSRDEITVGENTYAAYVKMTSAWPETAVYAEDNTGIFMTQSHLEDTYLDYTYKFHVNNGVTVYSSSDNGETKTALNSSDEYTLNDLTLWTDNFEAITGNDTYFGDGGDGHDYLTSTTTSWYFKDDLLQEILKGSYTKVEFNNTNSSTPLIINPEIVQQILFPNSNANNTITELDLGEATTTGFSHLLDHPSDGWKRAQNLAKVTLPLVAAVDNEVVLPANVIPNVYNKHSVEDPANLKTITVPAGYTKIDAKAFKVYYDEEDSKGYGSAQITTFNLPTSLKEIGDEAFMNCGSLRYINSSSAESQSIKFPSTNLTTIGVSAFEGCTSLTSTASDPFKLPASLKKIKASAFKNLTNLKFLELNEGLEYVGNTAFGLMSEVHVQTTITFPSTLKYLGPGSFISRWYQDIYFTGTTAPVCPVGKSAFTDWGNVTAFSANTQMGNNGFNPYHVDGSTADDAQNTGHANRENYINNGYYFTILHFPDGLTDAQAKTYRDITRRYVTGTDLNDGSFHYGGNIAKVEDPANPSHTFGEAFEEGTTSAGKSNLVYYMSGDGLLEESANATNIQPGYVDTYMGKQQIWPSQMQWTRNFVTVANGVEWDGKTVYEPTLLTDADLQKIFEWMKEDGLYVKANSLDYTAGNPRVPNSNDNSQGGVEFSLANKTNYASLTQYEKDYFKLILYQGTRRFVLSYDGGYDIPFIVKLKGGRWWSICLPFNMTKAEVDRVFGKGNPGTHVCLMSGVDRTVSASGNTLVLKFKNDVYRHRTLRTVTTSGDNLVYTYASNFDKNSKVAPGDNDIVIYARESYMIYPVRVDAGTNPVEYDFGSPVFETGNPLPTIVYSNSVAPYTTQNGEDPAYRFIGNFTTSTGNDAQGKAITIKIPQYSYAYGRANADDPKSKFFILETAGATWSPFKSIVQNTAVGGGLNDWNNFFQQNTARVNQVSLFGDDEEITGIDNVIIEVSSDNDEDLRVFNLNGSMMGNSLQGLPAGTYIQGGKAYRVK